MKRVDINSIVKSAEGLAKNAEIAVLKDAVDEAEELKKVNAVLVDVIEELKDEDAEADSNIS